MPEMWKNCRRRSGGIPAAATKIPGMDAIIVMKNCNVKKCKVIEKMKCDFCNGEFPAEELETIKGALHDSGDVEKYHVCETCAAWIDEQTGRRAEK